MARFDVPCCSVCYEYLTSDLCALTRCGHVYHRHCIAQWTERTDKHKAGCPLCRCHIPPKGLIELKLECGEHNGTRHPTEGDTTRELTSEEIEDLRHRLAQASSDKLDLQERCAAIENENSSLQEALLHSRDENAVLSSENEDLKLEVAANKTTIAKLQDLITKQKTKLKKLEDVHNYLKPEELGDSSYKTHLKSLSPEEKLNLLINRVAELEGVNKTLSELRDFWKRKCEKMNREYLMLEREYKASLSRHSAAPAFQPDPLHDNTTPYNGDDIDQEPDVPRKVRRAVDFGLVGSKKVIGGTKTLSRTQHHGFALDPPSGIMSPPKVKTQKISNFFKSQDAV
ncbi:ring finger domain containing protein protein, putative [Babesia ovis]|uniref:Ring finger domain containing protein protein, putative n=1 Tax=Babesia ovis TaxID=5869 RepID=A0A9W5TBF5_BABOV|nr:ring finger domain containing protein protein, putative [Babesia ovis]